MKKVDDLWIPIIVFCKKKKKKKRIKNNTQGDRDLPQFKVASFLIVVNFSWICERAKELQVPTIQIRILHKQFTVDQAMKEMMKYSLASNEFAIGFSNLDLSFDPKRLVQLEDDTHIAEEVTAKKKEKSGKGGKSPSNATTVSKFSVTDAELVGNSLQNTNKGVGTECPVTEQPSGTGSPLNSEVLVSESAVCEEPLVADSLVIESFHLKRSRSRAGTVSNLLHGLIFYLFQ